MARPQPPPTRLTLLHALREGLRWEEFVALYGPLLLCWGRRDFGLQESDAENLRQEVLLRVWRSLAAFDPSRGRFRGWLYVCTRNAASDLRRSRRHEVVGAGPVARSCLGCVEAPEDECVRSAGAGEPEAVLRDLEDRGFAPEWLHAAVVRVRGRVQPQTWKAFLLFELLGLSAKEIAPRLDLSPTAVNQAVFRVRRLLHRELTA
jgi:RNA polymerase sigma-70 factor (ECF subfamily)